MTFWILSRKKALQKLDKQPKPGQNQANKTAKSPARICRNPRPGKKETGRNYQRGNRYTRGKQTERGK
tara:strand:- start:572 stop:775 length:204 start_codon:yes stop_codon:yes gene_type:complete